MDSHDLPKPGEHWAYRKASHLPATEVEILTVTQNGRKTRIETRRLDNGQTEEVTLGKLPTRWDTLESFLKSEATWRWLTDFDLHEVETDVLDIVFIELVPESVASLSTSRNRVATIHDIEEFEALIDCTLVELARHAPVDFNGEPRIGTQGALIAGELICRRTPQPILDLIHAEEVETRHTCKHGRKREHRLRDEDPDTTSPEWEWHFYLTYTRPRHELLRQWCGFRSVTADERRRAAEEEVRRLDLLLSEAVESLGQHDERRAQMLTEEHEAKRITPGRVRPQIDRPLRPDEIPVREVKVRARRWW